MLNYWHSCSGVFLDTATLDQLDVQLSHLHHALAHGQALTQGILWGLQAFDLSGVAILRLG